MQDYWVVIIAVLSAIILLAALVLSLCFFIRNSKSKEKKKESTTSSVVREPSILGIHPKIPDPIYTISGVNSTEKEIRPSDTITTRKLSMMFDAKKRLSSAFSQRSSYFDFENSPQPRHKEYLDFNDIEKYLPTDAKPVPKTPARARLPNRISIIDERPFGGPTEFEPVREVFSENHMSFRRERPHEG